MDGIIQIGFITLAVDRLLAIAAIMSFVVGTPLLAGLLGIKPPRIVVASVLGIAASRLAYVIANLDAFRVEPTSILWLWQGGFTIWPGAIVAAIVVALGRSPAGKRLALATIPLGISILWVAAHHILAPPPKPFPTDMVVSTVDGRPVHLDELRGQAFVVNLWATWCPPCQREMPMMVHVASNTSVPVLFVNQGETADHIQRFLRSRKLMGALAFRDPEGVVGVAIGSPALPTTIFVDAAGKVRMRHFGEISRAALTAAIHDLERNPI